MAPQGSSVALVLYRQGLRVIVVGIVFHFLVILLYCWNLKVVEVSESGFISSEKVALTLVLRATSVAPLSCSKLLLSSRT